jgi:hypothetical protein
MKPNLLEQLIKKALLEQDEKKVIIGPMSKSGRNDVIAAGGITGFTVTMKYRGQAPTMESIIDRLQDQVAANSQIGRGSGYDVRDKSDDATSRYMYVIGDDIAKSKRILKMNVWVLLYSPLMQLAQQIDSLKNNDRYYEQMTGVIQWYAGGIPVYTYNDAAKWISILKNQSSNLKLDLTDNQLKKKIAFPNLTTINKQELDQEKISGETKIVTIDNTNRKEYGNIRFTGTAEMSYDAYGGRDITYINGSTPVTRILDGTPGIYTGDFKNGMPSNGKTVWDDGEVWEGEMSSSVVKDPDTGLPDDYNFEKSDNTKVSNSKEVIKTQVANTSSDEVTNSSTSDTELDTLETFTYPAFTEGNDTIVTTSETDDWVYMKRKNKNGTNYWFTMKKSDFENNSGTGFKYLPDKKGVYSKLNKLLPAGTEIQLAQ